jgi:hypothetical protein
MGHIQVDFSVNGKLPGIPAARIQKQTPYEQYKTIKGSRDHEHETRLAFLLIQSLPQLFSAVLQP